MATQNAASGNKETGAIGRLHSALMAVLTHLVSRLGFLAISHPAVEAVLFPLLAHALDTRQPHQDLLIDEALPLVQATLTSTPSIAQPHMQVNNPPQQPPACEPPQFRCRPHLIKSLCSASAMPAARCIALQPACPCQENAPPTLVSNHSINSSALQCCTVHGQGLCSAHVLAIASQNAEHSC